MGYFWELRISAILKGCNKLQMLDGSDLTAQKVMSIHRSLILILHSATPKNSFFFRCGAAVVHVGNHNALPGNFYPSDILYANDDLTDREKRNSRLASELRSARLWFCRPSKLLIIKTFEYCYIK